VLERVDVEKFEQAFGYSPDVAVAHVEDARPAKTITTPFANSQVATVRTPLMWRIAEFRMRDLDMLHE